MQTAIRKATLEDVPLVAPLFDAYRVFYDQPADPGGALRFLQERLGNDQSVLFIALSAGRAVGFVQLYPIFSSVSMKRAWLLNDLYVDISERGKGVATSLLESAKNYGRSTSGKWLMLQTHADNYQAQALYEKNGWKREKDLFYVFDL